MTLIRTPKEEGHYTLKRVDRLPKRGNYNILYALRTTNLDRLFRWLQEGNYEEILLGGGGITSVVAGTDISVDSTDPLNPIVSVLGTFVRGVVSGDDISVDNTDPDNPIINFTGSVINSVVPGTGINIDNTDPNNPVISTSGNNLQEVVAGMNVTVDVTDPLRPIVNAMSGITSVQAGTNITIDNTNPSSPIISAISTGGLQSIVAGTDILVDNTDPLNPIINSMVSIPELTSAFTNDGSNGTSTYVEIDELAGVATTGDYNDLINTPALGVQSVVAGTNVTVDNTDPQNPIVSSTATGGGITSVVAGTDISVDSTDPLNPIVNFTGVIPTGFEAINEGNGIGYRLIGKNSANYGNIGLNAIDGSTSDASFFSSGATGDYSTISGGLNNTITGNTSSIGGGQRNSIGSFSQNSVISGGVLNVLGRGSNFSTIGGGSTNSIIANASGATIGGGFENTINGSRATISGGFENTGELDSTISGGRNNTAGNFAVIGGGTNNVSSGEYSSILGGQGNFARSYGEVCVGILGTDYIPASTIAHVDTDRIFNVGIGVVSMPADGFTILKGGEVLAPAISNVKIDVASPKVLVTKEWVQANSGAVTNLTFNAVTSEIESDTGTNAIISLADASNSGLLSHYEEGTWVVTATDSAGGAIYTIGSEFSKYTRIGNLVTFTINLSNINTSGTPTGDFRISLPFSVIGTSALAVSRVFGSNVNFYSIVGNANNSSSFITFDIQQALDGSISGVGSTLSAVTWTNGRIFVSGSFFVA